VFTNVVFSGTEAVGETLSGGIIYFDAEGDAAGTHTYQWYRADDALGTNEAAISGATSINYTLVSADEGKFVRLGAIPVALTGTSPGLEVFSSYSGAIANNSFITTWETTTASESITVPHTGTGYSFDIDWGDGTVETSLTEADAPFSHTYAVAGTQTVTISGTFPRIYFNNGGDKTKIRTVENWGDVGATSMVLAFFGCSNLTTLAAGLWDASSYQSAFQSSGVTAIPANFCASNASGTTCFQMFYGCSSITTVGANAFSGLTACTNFSRLFYLCSGLTTTPSNIFTGCVGMTDIGEGFTLTGMTSVPNSLLADQASLSLVDNLFNQAAVTTIGTNVFHASAPLSTFSQMFYNCGTINASDIGDWPISSVTNMTGMFFGCTINTTDYNAMLVGWEAQTEQTGVTFHGGSSTHSGAGTTARGVLTGTSSWTITDGGAA
jgi:hypothetical protein